MNTLALRMESISPKHIYISNMQRNYRTTNIGPQKPEPTIERIWVCVLCSLFYFLESHCDLTLLISLCFVISFGFFYDKMHTNLYVMKMCLWSRKSPINIIVASLCCFFFIVCAPFKGRILSSVVVYKWPKAMTASVSLLISLNSLIRVQCAVINIRATINLRQIWFVSLMLLPVIISSYIPWERWREHTCEQRAYVCVRVRCVDVKAFDRRSVPSHRLKHRQVFFFSVVVEIFRIFFFMIWNFILILRRINSDERYVIWK